MLRLLLLAAACIILLPACQPSTGKRPGAAQLPSVTGLASISKPGALATEYVEKAKGTAAIKRGGAGGGTISGLVLDGSDEPAWALYESSLLLDDDRLDSTTVEVDIPGSDDSYSEVEIKVLLADSSAGDWVELGTITSVGKASLEINGSISPGNWSADSGKGTYVIGVVVEGGRAEVNSITWKFILTSGEFAGFHSGLHEREILGKPVAFNVLALDENGRICTSFNQELAVTSSSEECRVLEGAEFANGVAYPQVMSEMPGEYALQIKNPAGGDLPLGAVEFYETRLPVVEISIPRDSLAQMFEDPWHKDYFQAEMAYAGQRLNDAGVRFRGRNARAQDKKSFKVKLGSGNSFEDTAWGFSRDVFNFKANVEDPTMMREVLTYDLLHEMGAMAPNARLVLLRVNHETYGVYTDAENLRKPFLRRNGLDDSGDLYEVAFEGRLVWEHERTGQIGNSGSYEKKCGQDDSMDSLDDFCMQLDRIGSQDSDLVFDDMKALVDTKQLNSTVATYILTSSADNWIHNYYLYYDLNGTGKWINFPWDLDLTWGLNYGNIGERRGHEELKVDQDYKYGVVDSVLTTCLIYSEWMWLDLEETMVNAIAAEFSPAVVHPKIDEYFELIRQDALAEKYEPLTPEEFKAAVQALKDYVPARGQFLLDEFAAHRAKFEEPMG